jgi:hypothetical protein
MLFVLILFWGGWICSCEHVSWWRTKIENTRKGLSILIYENEECTKSKYISKYKIKKLKLDMYIQCLEIHKQENAISILNDLNETHPLPKEYPLVWLFREKKYIGSYDRIPYYIRDTDFIYKNICYLSKEEDCIRYITSQNKYVYIHTHEYDIRYMQKAIKPFFYMYLFFNLDEIKDTSLRTRLYNYLMLKYKLLYRGETVWRFSNGYYMDNHRYD